MAAPLSRPLMHIGTAGWSIPRASAHRFEGDGTHLERYARLLPCAEINSSFYRPHAATTYARWAARTPPHFRFAVKIPKTITHVLKLVGAETAFTDFLEQSDGLGEKRGPLLIQLPPSFAFDASLVSEFLSMVRQHYRGPLVCEPRHATWFTPSAEPLLVDHHVGRVAADPALAANGGIPAGWPWLAYYRLHGSPRTYWSRYDNDALATLAGVARQHAAGSEFWCIFDNTASGAALENARQLQSLVVGNGGADAAAR